jgi:hypothetical protein
MCIPFFIYLFGFLQIYRNHANLYKIQVLIYHFDFILKIDNKELLLYLQYLIVLILIFSYDLCMLLKDHFVLNCRT